MARRHIGSNSSVGIRTTGVARDPGHERVVSGPTGQDGVGVGGGGGTLAVVPSPQGTAVLFGMRGP